MADLLGAIANPQLADVAGALDYRQAKIEADEKKRKEIRANQLIAQSIPNLDPNGVMYELMKNDPQKGIFLAKTMGVPLNSLEHFDYIAAQAKNMSAAAKASPDGAYDYAKNLLAQNQQMGIETPQQVQKFVSQYEQEPDQRTALNNSVHILAQSLNPAKGEQMTADQAEKNKLAREEFEWKKTHPNAGLGDQTPASLKEIAYYNSLPAGAEKEAVGRKLGLVSKEGQTLSGFSEKLVETAANDYTSAISDASKYQNLATQLRSTKMPSGAISGINEFVKSQTGGQDDITSLRNQVRAIVNSEAIKNLPAGPATDKDISLALAPLPEKNADPEYIANWLDAVGRLSEKKAKYAEFKANFVAENGTVRTKDGKSVLSAWRDAQGVEPESNQQISGKTKEISSEPTTIGRFQVKVH